MIDFKGKHKEPTLRVTFLRVIEIRKKKKNGSSWVSYLPGENKSTEE